MLRKTLILAVLVALLALPLAGTAFAKVEKYTFTNVQIDNQLVTIYASLKTVNKGDFTHCDYHDANTGDFLGYYQAPTTNVVTEEDVFNFCVNNFDNRVQ